ncbi:YggT family protein [Fructobacillus sp. M2-14]|uniref:YggT family protein n=1 Tax=Fructobacillus broussonetiae TaxID=2713173 RepID=A0ABS5R1E5_9LACO|nr:YggT family protein [Fructobacillus broussonetiae]MBS9338446.1 YggT family protein [Fructobacillus broussonetiae]
MMLSPIITILLYAIQFYTYALLIFVLMSWVPRLYSTWFGRELGKLIRPYLNLFSFIKPLGFFDFRPLAALIVLQLIETGLTMLVS